MSGITFAYLRVARKQTNQNELIVLKCLDIELTDEQDDILINNAFAITDEDGKHTTPYIFKIKNKCDLTLRINVNLENLAWKINWKMII